MSKETQPTYFIHSKQSVFSLNLKEVWAYRDLLLMLVKKDFITFYKQTILGPIWFFLQPLLTTITYVLIFGRIAKLSTDGIPMILFYLAGITIWNYFAETLTKTATVFKDNAQMFGKVYFPRLAMPLSIVVANLVRFGIQISLFLLVWVWYLAKGAAVHPNIYILLVPVLVMMMGLLGLGLGMIINALTTKYRDLIFLLTFGIQLLMFATPVIYPLSSLPEKYKWIILANPMSEILEAFKFAFLGSGSFSWFYLLYSLIATLVILVFGTIIFNRVEKSFTDTV